jgi:hypothetical protein
MNIVSMTLQFVLKPTTTLLKLSEVTMTEKHSWYKAALRRKKIAEAKRLKAARYVEEMNKRANDKPITSSTG